ncbi:hypothetical protein AB0896_27385 [Streptomyces parvulus]|uniref:hypothetical protein n=1 Tax=Streptomyces parvulus TaxID=146923 RepID=UPI00345311E3
MPSPRRTLHAAVAGAVLLAAAAANALAHGLYIPAACFGLGVLILTEAALREHRRLRRRRLEAEWVRRRALGEHPAPLNPCCLLAQASHGEAHSATCTGEHSLARFLDHIEQQHREDV